MALSDHTKSTVAGVLTCTFDDPECCGYSNIVIPEFQRPYCWRVSDIRKLLNDVDALRFRSDKQGYVGVNGAVDPYYFGTVCFQEAHGKEGAQEDAIEADGTPRRRLMLLDGQQRITSLYLLTALLYRRALEHDDPEIREFPSFVDALLGPAWRDLLIVKQPKTIRHIGEIYREFDREYEVCRLESELLEKWTQVESETAGAEESSQETMPNFYTQTLRRDCARMRFILKHCVFAVTLLKTPREASQFFQAENNRGLAMGLLDILKAHHMRFAADSTSLAKMQRLWAAFNVQEETSDGESDEKARKAEAAEAEEKRRQRRLVEQLVLPVILMPYGVDPQTANDTVHVDLLKGLLGTPRRDRLVDEKITRLAQSQKGVETTGYVADLLSPIQPGLAFFEMLDQYRRIADAVDALCSGFPRPFADADRVHRWALIGWVDRFLPLDVIGKSAAEIKAALERDLDFQAYRQAVYRFLRILSRQKYGDQILGVYDQVRFVRVSWLMGIGSTTESLFLLPHRSISPAACLQEFNRRTTPEFITPKIWQSTKKEAYRVAYEALPVIVANR